MSRSLAPGLPDLTEPTTPARPALPSSGCYGCSACFNACPSAAISMRANSEGFEYPQVGEACSGCLECERACPALDDVSPPSRDAAPESFAAWNKCRTTRLESSSGGVFSSLAEAIFARGGAVFGAAFDGSFVLRHACAVDMAGLAPMRGSKYLQSRIGSTFAEAGAILASGKWLLFSGIPCQIAGLYGCLGGDHERLVTCDLACHGVPSPKIFRKNLEELGRKAGSAPTKLSFRDKSFGWKKFAIRAVFADGSTHMSVFRDDPYMKLFLAGLSIRQSCAGCGYSRLPRVADLSLADFWGVRRIMPEIDDAEGVSLVLVNSRKGKDLLAEVSGKGKAAGAESASGLRVLAASLMDAVVYNPRIVSPAGLNPDRGRFFDRIDEISLEAAVSEFRI